MQGIQDDPDIYLVEWEAAKLRHDSTALADITEVLADSDGTCYSIGWLIFKSEDCIILSATRTGDAQTVGLMQRIPRGAILRMELLPPTQTLKAETPPEVDDTELGGDEEHALKPHRWHWNDARQQYCCARCSAAIDVKGLERLGRFPMYPCPLPSVARARARRHVG